MHYSYCAHFEQDPNGGFLVTFTDVPETITHGETMVEAKANAV
ncbi:type II toxin-antitoxin system HicB family antitoxin [Phyllobacterium sp. 22552]